MVFRKCLEHFRQNLFFLSIRCLQILYNIIYPKIQIYNAKIQRLSINITSVLNTFNVKKYFYPVNKWVTY